MSATTTLLVGAGILGKRGYAPENVVARTCLETGSRVTTNVLLRERDFGLANDAAGRRLDVVADGRPLFGGAQLDVDTTVVSALRNDGTARPHAASWNPNPRIERIQRLHQLTRQNTCAKGNSCFSAVGLNRRGASVGVPCCPVRWHGQWRLRC